MEFRSADGRRKLLTRFKSEVFFRVLAVTLLFVALSFTPLFSAARGGSGASLRRRDVSLKSAEVGH
jgi:hypothetical protein